MLTTTNTPKETMVNHEKLYDLCMIEKLCRGNQQQVMQMISVFVNQVPASVEEIKAAYKRNDFDLMQKTAHRIKPVLSFYAVIMLEKEILQIEAMAKGILAKNELNSKIELLESVVTRIVEQMKKTLLY